MEEGNGEVLARLDGKHRAKAARARDPGDPFDVRVGDEVAPAREHDRVARGGDLVDAADVPVAVALDGAPAPYAPPSPPAPEPLPGPHAAPEAPAAVGPACKVPLEALAWARSGDKGDAANIGVIARDPAFLPHIWAALTPETVAARFGTLAFGRVERFPMPGIHGLNLLLHASLGGGGMASLRWDAQGKAYAQRLLGLEIELPEGLLP